MKENITHLQQQQKEKLAEIGSRLRQARQAQFLSVDEVAIKTCIQARLIRAIEDGNRAALPEAIYIKALLKQLADALEVNATDLTKGFPDDASLHFLQPSWRRFPRFKFRPIHFYLLYIALVVGVVSSFSHYLEQTQASRKDPKISSEETQLEGSESSVPKVRKQIALAAPPHLGNKEKNLNAVVVDVTVEDQSWLKIIADGQTKFEGVLEEGNKKTWTAHEQITVLAGNAGGVLVAFNDQKAKKLGRSGQVEQITYPTSPKS